MRLCLFICILNFVFTYLCPAPNDEALKGWEAQRKTCTYSREKTLFVSISIKRIPNDLLPSRSMVLLLFCHATHAYMHMYICGGPVVQGFDGAVCTTEQYTA